MNDFPEIVNGQCDGMDCGIFTQPCFCDMMKRIKVKYQNIFNEPWDDDNEKCKIWIESFRLTDSFYRKIIDYAIKNSDIG